MIWHAVIDAEGRPVSFGTVVAPAEELAARGLSVISGDVPDGKTPGVVDGRLVGVDPTPPEPAPPTLEDRLAAVERVLVDRAMATESELSMEVRR